MRTDRRLAGSNSWAAQSSAPGPPDRAMSPCSTERRYDPGFNQALSTDGTLALGVAREAARNPAPTATTRAIPILTPGLTLEVFTRAAAGDRYAQEDRAPPRCLRRGRRCPAPAPETRAYLRDDALVGARRGNSGRVGLLIVSAAIGALAGYLAVVDRHPSASQPLPIYPDGIGPARFGQSEQQAVSELDARLATAPVSKILGTCATVEWSNLFVWFLSGYFVGYSVRSEDGSTVRAATVNGLRAGDSVTVAQRLYGQQFSVPTGALGSWVVTTAQGQIGGYLSWSYLDPRRPDIQSIGAGLGCEPGDVWGSV